MSEPPVRLTGSLADRDAWRADDCSIAAALEVLGAQSSFLLLREAMYGATRFEEFVRRTGLSEPVVAARLRALVDAGLLDREPYRDPGQRSRQAYALTERGTALLPAFVALLHWGDRWVAPNGGPVEFRHRGCDHTVDVHLVCSAGHTVEPEQLDLRARRRPPR